MATCHNCSGEGDVAGHPCDICEGSGEEIADMDNIEPDGVTDAEAEMRHCVAKTGSSAQRLGRVSE